MVKDINYILNNISDVRIAVIGLGISNVPLIKYLYSLGARNITVYDKNDNEYVRNSAASLISGGIISKCTVGEDYLDKLSLESCDAIFRSPGIRPDLPQLNAAKEKGAVITSEMELFFELCPCKIYGVTGSDGKSTTTTLLWRLLSAHYKNSDVNVWLGGNIGRPLIDILPEIKEADCVVLELSSFQLMTMNKSPDVSIITNISPNHLDVHKDYNEYIDAKRNIYLGQNENGVVVLNAHNDVTAGIAKELLSEGRRVRLFSAYVSSAAEFDERAEAAAFEREDSLKWSSSLYNYSVDRKMLLIPGKFNAENLLAAVSACGDVITLDDIFEAIKDFKGVEHRCEFVREMDGVRFYNSSIDSSPNRTIQTLTVFDGNVILIAGGKDKKIPYDDIGPAIIDKVKVLILTGPTADKIEAAVRKALSDSGKSDESIKIWRFTNYKDAVKCAYENAESGDKVLLSPASTSFDMFRNFEERGNVYKSLVGSLE